MKRWIILTLLSIFFLSLAACNTAVKRLAVMDAWARPGLTGGNSAVYFTVENATGENERLLGASSDAARAVEMHLSSMDEDGVMTMARQESVELPAGESLEFKPAGMHIMLIDLPEDLEVGDSFPLILTFEKMGTLTLNVKVREP